MIGNYYLNGPDLISSTSVYMDSDLTVYAPDGFYKQGTTTRQLLDTVLLPPQVCDSCAMPCGLLAEVEGGELGVYIMSIEVGPSVGAIVIRVNPQIMPKGIYAEFDSTIYNKLSSETYGYLAAPTAEATYVGDEYFDCGLVDDSPHTLQVYRYDGSGFTISTGETQSITVNSGQLELTADEPGECVMVIPKVTTGSAVVTVSVIAACQPTDFDITVNCAAQLEDYASSMVSGTNTGACALAVDQTYYVVPVNGDGVTLGLYDYVYYDINGQNPLPDGYYYSPTAVPGSYDYYQVENGVVVAFDICPAPVTIGWEIREDQPGSCVLNTYNMRMRIWRGVIPVLDQPGPATGTTASETGTFLARFDLLYTDNASPTVCCDMEMVIEWEGTEIATLNIGAAPTPPTVDAPVLQTTFVIAGSGTLRMFTRCA